MKRVINNSLFYRLCIVAILVCAEQTLAAARLGQIARLQELAQQPLITLKTGEQVRLGIGPLDHKIGPWRIVYCLVEKAGDKEQRVTHFNGGDALGPVMVRCDWDGDKAKIDQSAEVFAAQGSLPKLFRHPIPITRPGKATIRVYDNEGTDLATLDIHVEAPQPVAWRRFADERWEGDPAKRILMGSIKPVLAVPASMSGTSLLADEEPPLKLSIENNTFHIDAGKRKINDLPRRLAARWWVNGELQVPKQVLQQEMIEQMGRPVRDISSIEVPFYLPEDLNALRIGDRVSLQVFYNAGGWKQPPLGQMNARQLAMEIASASEERVGYAMSNRLEFVVTREMLAKP